MDQEKLKAAVDEVIREFEQAVVENYSVNDNEVTITLRSLTGRKGKADLMIRFLEDGKCEYRDPDPNSVSGYFIADEIRKRLVGEVEPGYRLSEKKFTSIVFGVMAGIGADALPDRFLVEGYKVSLEYMQIEGDIVYRQSGALRLNVTGLNKNPDGRDNILRIRDEIRNRLEEAGYGFRKNCPGSDRKV